MTATPITAPIPAPGERRPTIAEDHVTLSRGFRRPPPLSASHRWPDRRRLHRALGAVLAVNAFLGLWQLRAMGLQDSYYTATAWSGSRSWQAFFFAGLDPAGGAAVDKPPVGFWLPALSIRLFGLNTWSLLLPQVLMGIACAAVLFALVRRLAGDSAGLLAALTMTLIPVSVWIFRGDKPDAMLTLLLVCTAYCVVRALPGTAAGWMTVAGLILGMAFDTKMLQALLPLPALILVFAVAAHGGWRRRLVGLLAAGGALLLASSWWILLVDLTPAASRPPISSTQANSAFDLAFGFNGVARLTGSSKSAPLDRLFVAPMGPMLSALLPAAMVALVALLVATRHTRRTQLLRAAGVLFGTWLVVGGLVLTFTTGPESQYYVLTIAPAVAGLIGCALPALWRARRHRAATGALIIAMGASGLWGAVLLHVAHPRLSIWLAALGIAGCAAVLLGNPRRRALLAAAVVGAAVLLPSGALAWQQNAAHRHPVVRFGDDPLIVAAVANDRSGDRFSAAIVGGQQTGDLELRTRRAVLDIGGYRGTDALPSLAQFEVMVRLHEIHYLVQNLTPPAKLRPANLRPAKVYVDTVKKLISAGVGAAHHLSAGRESVAKQIELWVASHFRPTYHELTAVAWDLQPGVRPPVHPVARPQQ